MLELSNKVFKDPVYGYIEVDTELIKTVIDTPTFQRLRRIIQTSYTPLYATATHNRFTHSLGVYFLGNIAINAIKKKHPECFSSLPKFDKVFLYACLLHDVGHAPFSHTGEKFYLIPLGNSTKLHEHLTNLINSQKLINDIQSAKAAAPHEIMSAIVGLEQFPEILSSDDEKEFFARAITGYHYSERNKTNSIKNCLIDLLNSKFIDVDKLDYLIRDAYMTGFETVNIDYERLLGSLDIILDDEDEAHLVFEKNAISVIENVVYARDLEKKWIQIHPAVLYDIYLIEKSMVSLKEKLDVVNEVREVKDSIFSFEALTENGVTLNDSVFVKYLCDDDLIYLLKNKYPNSYFNEYLDRNARRHPLWKSESEYKSFFISSMNEEEINRFNTAMEKLSQFLSKNGFCEINDGVIKSLEKESKKTEKLLKSKKNDESDKQSLKALIKDKKEMLYVLNSLKEFSDENNIEFSFILLKNDLFYSAFGNDDFLRIKILFKKDDASSIKEFGRIASFGGKEKTLNDFYYLFYKRNADNKDYDIQSLVRKIRGKYL